jgi:small-conductance mechanosensitive channel
MLYLHDNASRMFMVEAGAGVVTGGGYLGYSFDIGMYTLCLGVVGVLATLRWLPNFLRRRFGIEEVSLQTVITRLAVIAISAATTLRAALLFGVPASSVLGVSGVGGLTFGLAARDVLSNVMGGTMLAILRPFKVGEEIFVTQGSNFRGSDDPSVSDYLVREIGWYQTTLEAKDTKPTIVPNGYFLGANVINVTRATARVMILEFRVSYPDREAVPGICEAIETYLRDHPKCDSTKYPVRVNLGGAKSDHLAIVVEFHVYKLPLDEHLRVRGRLIFDMLAVVEARTTGPAYPTEISLETSLTKYSGK